MPTKVLGIGNPNAKLLVLGEAPGYHEDIEGAPFVGKSGEFLDKIFSSLNYSNWRTAFWVTNVYKYRPPNNNIKLIHTVCDVQEEIENLYREIRSIKPACILALGKTALEAVTGYNKLMNYRGAILSTSDGDIKVVSTLHPSNLLNLDKDEASEDRKPFPYVWRDVFINDVRKAIFESEHPNLGLPDRLLYSAKSSSDVFNFTTRHTNKDRIFIDIETFGSTIPVCVSLAWDEHESISIPLIQKIKGVQISTMPVSELTYIWKFLDQLFRRQLIAGQNLKFDQPKLEMLGFTFKGIKSDTSIKAWTINPEIPLVNLGFLASIFCRENYWKDEGKEFQWGKHNIERLFLYNAKDSAVDAEIDRKLDDELMRLSEEYHTNLYSFYYDYMIKLHGFYSRMEKTGFRVDERQRNFLIDKYEVWLGHLQAKFQALTGDDININSPKQVAELLYERLKLKPYRNNYGTGEEVISQLLKRGVNEHHQQILSDILEHRRIQKTLSTYLYAMPDFDGRMRTQYRITGTETGRSSTAILEEPVRPIECGFAFQTLTKHGDIGSDIRSYLIADEGFVFVNIDLSQAEARVVALLSEDYEFLDAMDHIDVHRRMAACALISGKLNLSYDYDPVADIIGKDSAERFIGKKSKHATNYDMQYNEFYSVVVKDCRRFGINFTISLYSAEKILERIHNATPKVKSVYHKQIQECIDQKRALVGPYGDLRRFFDRVGPKLYKEAYADIPQNTVKQRLVRSGLNIESKRYPIRFQGEAHDALLFQMPIGEYIDICREIKPLMEQPIDFSGCSLPRTRKLIIPCDMEVGENYKDLRKLKL